jgi:iron-sulfur cluster repair protein YtfE (RIC family)
VLDPANIAPCPTVAEIFGRDHRGLDGLLRDAERSLEAGQAARAAVIFSRFREGLERHIEAEEEILFPAFEELTGITRGPTGVMRTEHEEIRRLLKEVAARLQPASDAAAPLAALTALLVGHNGKEERFLYPMIDRAAAEAGELEALVERIVL